MNSQNVYTHEFKWKLPIEELILPFRNYCYKLEINYEKGKYKLDTWKFSLNKTKHIEKGAVQTRAFDEREVKFTIFTIHAHTIKWLTAALSIYQC